jgi:ankyrin repeat protein
MDALAQTDKDGFPPLLYACRYWHCEMAAALVAHGADVHQTDKFNRRGVLHLAAM